MLWFISDTHFGHDKIIQYCNRPFQSIEEMHEVMIHNWNEVVGKDDTVYHLGDVGLNKAIVRDCIRRLNGRMLVVPGDHDKWAGAVDVGETVFQTAYDRVQLLPKIWTVYHEKQPIILCHYQMTVWPRSHYNSWQLYGHSHGRSTPVGKQMDVSVEAINYTPVSMYDVCKMMNRRENNRNFIGG